MKIKPNKEHIYTNDEGKKEFDYCESCQTSIDQIDLGDGAYGCPHCKGMNSISIYEVEE
jgi:hypothetical protein